MFNMNWFIFVIGIHTLVRDVVDSAGGILKLIFLSSKASARDDVSGSKEVSSLLSLAGNNVEDVGWYIFLSKTKLEGPLTKDAHGKPKNIVRACSARYLNICSRWDSL
jgi:hypothetical protein